MTFAMMPGVGETEPATVLRWFVAPDDRVAVGDRIALVETSKAMVDVQSDVAGVVSRLLVPVGAEITKGEPLMQVTAETDAAVPRPQLEPPTERVAIPSPDARIAAAEHGLRIELIRGTGPDGMVTRQDVERESQAGSVQSLTHGRALQLVLLAIADAVPTVDIAALDADSDFTEQTGLDSLEFLDVLAGIRARTGVEIPDADVPAVTRLSDAARYLVMATASAGAPEGSSEAGSGEADQATAQ